jgi:hypothetical protein
MAASQPVAQGRVTHAEREPAEAKGHENDVEHDLLRVAGQAAKSRAPYRDFIGARGGR